MVENVILITGAGQRVGLYLAKHFLKQGKNVFFTYKTPRKEIQVLTALGATGFQVDFTNSQQVINFLQAFKEQVYSVSLLVHNASIWLKDEKLDLVSYHEMIAVHQVAPYQITLGLIDKLNKSTQRADVIAVTDCKAKLGHADYVAYLGTKAALNSMMNSFAKKFAPTVKVNTIAPGLIVFNQGDTEEYRRKRLQEMAIPIEPTEMAIVNAVEFLINSPTSTGSTIEIGHLRQYLKEPLNN